MVPLNETLPARQRTEAALILSDLAMKVTTHVICHTLVECREQLEDERFAVAHAMLQRVMTTHLCNHKLTKEGLVYEYRGQPFVLHEAYKTMTLTREVYEHLAIYNLLYEHPKSDKERQTVWQNWKSENQKELVPYSQAWRYLFGNRETASLYHHLSLHCHPAYQGLLQYTEQSADDGGNEGVALYFSCRFLARLTRLFLKQVPGGWNVLGNEFSTQELNVFRALSTF